MKKTYEEWENETEEYLNEIYSPLKIGILEYPAGTTLKEIDPIAFRQIVLDYMDNEEEEMEPKGYARKEVSEDGSVMYWNDKGQAHREDGPAIEWADGTKMWCRDGKRHREGGPAIEWADGAKEWWVNGARHREDGPAYEGADGAKEYWLSGKKVTEEGGEENED